ncbi:MAG: HEAT repeat domain-containing protein [Rhodopirellula sp. JB055]|uniref:HEAT repeat domain-containing protein n=1 Tax=Rhodopirellula sp. JB055 TaxID=3342846 RepID=UPI00370C8B19
MADRFFARFLVAVFAAGWVFVTLGSPHTFAQEAAEDEASIALPPDPLVEQLKLKASGGPEALGRSLNALAKIRAWSAVDELLQPLASNAPAADRAAKIASQIGSDQRLRITSATDVSDEAKQALDGIFDARAKALREPSRLQAAIKKLTSSNPDDKSAAYRTLFRAGEYASAALIDDIVRTSAPEQRREDLRVLLKIDRKAGIAGLRRVALYGADSTRSKAFDALAMLGSDEAQVDLLTQRLEAAADVDLATREPALQIMRLALEDAMNNAVASQHDFGNVSVWAINAKRDGVVPTQAATWVVAFRDAADAASRLSRVGDTEHNSVVQQLTAQLAYRVANDPDWGDAKNRDDFFRTFFGKASAEEVLAAWAMPVLANSVETENDPAAVGVLRLIDGDLSRGLAETLLRRGAKVSELVETVDHSNATVRYEAAAAIARLLAVDPELTFAGMSRVEDRWHQMATLGDKGVAIVLENRPEIISSWQRIMAGAGFQPKTVSSVASLERLLSLGDDVRLIVSKEQPRDASAIEMIDVVRRMRVGRDVPLLIYSPAPMIETPEVIEEEIDQRTEAQKEFDANLPDQFGVRGGIDSLDIEIETNLIHGTVDRDWTKRRELDLQLIGQTRWADESLQAGVIRSMPRPRSAAGLYEILLDSRRRAHLPTLTPSDRVRYRLLALDALAMTSDE